MHTQIFIIDNKREEYDKLIQQIEFNTSYRIAYFANTKDAMSEILASNYPHLAIVGLEAPENGSEFVQFLKMDDATKDIIVIVTCKNATGRKIADAIGSGCDDVVQIPFDENALATRLVDLLKY